MTELISQLISKVFVEQPWLHRVCKIWQISSEISYYRQRHRMVLLTPLLDGDGDDDGSV